MKWTLFVFILLLFSYGCGKKVDSSEKAKSVSSAEALINKGEFEKAISILEPLLANHPDDEKIKIKLFHAYAGAGTFEALKVINIWKKMERELKKKDRVEKRNSSDKSIGRDFKTQGLNLQARVNRILAPLPTLTTKQTSRLNQAIELYQELGMKVETAGRYSNFKWGTLHVYRLAINAKLLMKDIDRAVKEKPFNRKKVEAAVLSKVSVMGQDIFLAYRLYGNSFDNIQKLTNTVDKMISSAVEDKKFKLKINETAMNQAEFFHNILSDNISAASILVKKIGDLYSGNRFENSWQGLMNFAPTGEEINESQKNILALVRIFLKSFAEKHDVDEKVNGLFNEEFKTLLTNAAHQSIQVKNMDPLQKFLESKRKDVQVIVAYYKVLRDEIKESELDESIRQELRPLSKRISMDILQDELKKIEADLKQERSRLQTSAISESSEKLKTLTAQRDAIISQVSLLTSQLGRLKPLSSDSVEPEAETPVEDDSEEDSEQEDQEPDENDEEEKTEE